MMRRALLLTTVMSCWLGAAGLATAASPKEGQVRRVHLAVIAEVDGQFADWRCDAGDAKRMYLAQLVGSLRARKTALRAQGKVMTSVVTGDLLGTSSVARHMLSEHDSGVAGLASALTRTDTMMFAVGNGELAHPPAKTDRFARALVGAGVPFGSVNLSCEASRTALCRAQGRQVVNINGVKTGFFALQYDDFDTRVSPKSLKGLKWTDPAEATVKALKTVSAQNVELKIGVVHRGSHGSPEADLTQMAEALRGWVSLLITDAVAADATVPRLTQVGVGANAVQVLSVPGGANVWYEVVVDVAPSGRVTLADARAHRITKTTPQDPQIGRWLAGEQRRFCARWSEGAFGVSLKGELSASDFVLMALHVMRQAGGGDVSVINSGAFEFSGVFPVRNRLNRRAINEAIRFKNRLVRVTLTGDELQELIDYDPGPDEGKKDLHWVGVKVTDKGTLINGRPIVSRLKYRLVTIDFLAQGGDETFEPFTKPKRVAAGRTLRQLVERWLRSRGKVKLGDPADEFIDYWDRPLVTLNIQGKLDFSSLQYANGAGYVDPRLTNLDFRQLDVALDSSLNFNTRDHGWLNRLMLNYSETRGVDRSEGVVLPYRLVNTDIVQADMTYQYRYVRDTMLDRAWWAPLPIVYGRIRAELDVPDGQRYRWADIDGLLGLGWEPIGQLQVRFGVGLNRELLRTEPGPYFRPMLQFGYLLPQTAIAKVGGGQLLLQLEADIRVKGIGGDQRETYYLDNTLMAPLWGPLRIYAQLEYFAMRARGPLNDLVNPSRANEWTQQMRISAGLALTLLRGVQVHGL